jgi:Spy/CpxP family protein refolding chaperone
MKRIILIALVLTFAAAGTASAQMQAGFGPPEGANPGARLVEELGLDEYQAAEIAAIFEEARAVHNEERAKSLETHAAIKAETHAAVMALLSEEQQARFEELQQLRAERWSDGPGRGQGSRSNQQGSGPGNGVCTGGGPGGPGGGNGGPGNGPGDGVCDGSGNCGG